MPDIVVLLAAATLTVAATALGVVPVVALGPQRVRRVRAALNGLTAGAMLIASFVGLFEPALEHGATGNVLVGAVAGIVFMMLVRRHFREDAASADGRWHVVAIGLSAHSLPEGLAIGTAFASGIPGLDVFVMIAIALQNVPEGTATALPMQESGLGTRAQVAAAIVTSLPQLLGAVAAFYLVELAESLLALSFGFAAGAMLSVTARELLPFALVRRHALQGTFGIVVGGALMAGAARVAGV